MMIFIFLIVLLIIAIVVLTVYFVTKKKPSWSSSQIDDYVNKIANDPGTPSLFKTSDGMVLLRCIATNLSTKYSYNDANNGKVTNSDRTWAMQQCFGTKGSWTPNFKTFFRDFFKSTMKSPSDDCLTCLINGCEKTIEPLDTLKQDPLVIQAINQAVATAMQNCPQCKTS